jgi:hypothetical protein
MVQDIGIENKQRQNGAISPECMVKCCIVVEPEVAPEPADVKGW